MRKLVAILCCIFCLTGFFGCFGNNITKNKVDISSEIEKIEKGEIDKMTIEWMIPTQQSIPTTDIPSIIKAAEKFNINLSVREGPVSQHLEQLPLGLADKSLPDIISWVSSANANANGPAGAFINLALYETEMKNFNKLKAEAIEKNPDNKNVLYNSNGEFYVTPHYMPEPINLFDFSISMPKFNEIKQKYNLTWAKGNMPSTWDEIEQVLINYKNDYEKVNTSYKCYPLTYRNFQSMAVELQLFVESFTEAQASTLDFFGFSEQENTFKFALDIPGYKEAIIKYADWYKKGLISPDHTADENNLKNQIISGDVIMIADFIGGWSGMNVIQRDVNYSLVPLQIPKAPDKKRIMGRQLTNFEARVGTALNSNLTTNPARLARAMMFLDYLYSDEFTETLWYNDEVTSKSVPSEDKDKSLQERRKFFSYNEDTVYNTSKDFDTLKLANTYFPWNICNTFVDYQDERPNPKHSVLAQYIDYRDNVLRAPYKEGYDRKTSEYVYGKLPTVLLNPYEQEAVLSAETAVWEQYKIGISAFAEGKKNFTGDWDAFVKKLKDAGGNQIIEIYNNAYKR